MKKLTALLLAVMLLMTSCLVFAEETEKLIVPFDDSLEFAMLLPEGYSIEFEICEGVLTSEILSDDSSKPAYYMVVAPDEEYSELVRLNDLTAEEYQAYVNSLMQDCFNATSSNFETSYGSKVVLIREDNEEASFSLLCGIYMGYALALYIETADGSVPDEEAVNTAIKIFSDMDFVYTENE